MMIAKIGSPTSRVGCADTVWAGTVNATQERMARICALTVASAIAMGLIAEAASSNRLTQIIEDRSDTRAVSPGTAEARVVRAQILLDRARFSPGQIDGRYGGDLGVAVKGYQEAHHLNP